VCMPTQLVFDSAGWLGCGEYMGGWAVKLWQCKAVAQEADTALISLRQCVGERSTRLTARVSAFLMVCCSPSGVVYFPLSFLPTLVLVCAAPALLATALHWQLQLGCRRRCMQFFSACQVKPLESGSIARAIGAPAAPCGMHEHRVSHAPEALRRLRDWCLTAFRMHTVPGERQETAVACPLLGASLVVVREDWPHSTMMLGQP